jgi:hypothetical protein
MGEGVAPPCVAPVVVSREFRTRESQFVSAQVMWCVFKPAIFEHGVVGGFHARRRAMDSGLQGYQHRGEGGAGSIHYCVVFFPAHFFDGVHPR